MPRPKIIRRVDTPPHFKGFRPIGLVEEKAPIIFNYEEYEAIRLSDYEFYGHVEASRIMGVSRPTYTRVYESARRKIAEAFVSGKAIVFEGGKVYFDSEWYYCNSCGCLFNHPEKDSEIKNCTLCGSSDIEKYKDEFQEKNTDNICQECNRENFDNGFRHQHRIRNEK